MKTEQLKTRARIRKPNAWNVLTVIQALFWRLERLGYPTPLDERTIARLVDSLRRERDIWWPTA